MPGRTDNEIKNVWYKHLKKRVISAGDEPEKKSVFSPSSSSDKSSISYCKPNEGLLALRTTQACGYVNMLEDTPCSASTVSGEEAGSEDERWARFLASELVLQDTSYAYSKRLARDRNQL